MTAPDHAAWLRASADESAEYIVDYPARMRAAADEMDRLRARVAELEAALKFYADKASWRERVTGRPVLVRPAAHIDGGVRARAALSRETDDAT